MNTDLFFILWIKIPSSVCIHIYLWFHSFSEMSEESETKLYGLLAEFDEPQKLIEAARRAHEAGYRNLQAYTPFSIEELSEYVKVRRRKWVPRIVFAGGLFGGLTGFLMQYFYLVIHYPINVGGRPLNSWQAFVPITFELTVLGGALFGVIGMLWLNGLPRPFHPVFTAPQFRHATQDEFFLCIEATDENFNWNETREFLEDFEPISVTDVFTR